MGVDPARMTVVPVGVDHTVFRPRPERPRVPGRIMVTSSSDVPMKGLVPLLEAVAKLRTERDVELVVIGRPTEGGRVARTIDRLGLAPVVRCVSGVTDDELACLYAEAQVAVVPSLYEGFSLPAIEAMACGVPLVATTGGALPEVVGHRRRDGPARDARRPRGAGRGHPAHPRRRRPGGAPGRGRPPAGARAASRGRPRPGGRPSSTALLLEEPIGRREHAECAAPVPRRREHRSDGSC